MQLKYNSQYPALFVDTSTTCCENAGMSEDTTKITRLQRKLFHTGMEVNDFVHDRPEYLHAIMCQLGLPRSRQDERTFERSVGRVSPPPIRKTRVARLSK
jgi:hypothetical protein